MQTIIRANELVKRLGISRTTLWRLENSDDFIPRIQLSTRAVGYLESDLNEYLERKRLQTKNNNKCKS